MNTDSGDIPRPLVVLDWSTTVGSAANWLSWCALFWFSTREFLADANQGAALVPSRGLETFKREEI